MRTRSQSATNEEPAEPSKRRQVREEAARAVAAATEPVSPVAATRFPELREGNRQIVEALYDFADPAGEFETLIEALEIQDALTPQALKSAQNTTETRALRAHRLYIVTKADCDRFEFECEQVMSALRDAANHELQKEKDAKVRSKAITDSNVVSQIAQMFPDEWAEISTRRARAEGMLKHIERLAKLWESRCKSVNSMLYAGKG